MEWGKILTRFKANRGNVTSRQPLVILHLLKTAGTAFLSYLESNLKQEEIIARIGDDKQANREIERVNSMSLKERQRIKVIFGHFAGSFRNLFPEAVNVTFVRDPFSRAVSQYYYERTEAHPLGLTPKDRPIPGEIPLREFCENFIQWGLNNNAHNFNLQARTIGHFFGMETDDVNLGNVTDLASKFEFIGLQNEFALSVFALSELYGLPREPVPSVYAGSQQLLEYFPSSFRQEVVRHSALDQMLFDIARERFEMMVSKLLEDVSVYINWQDYRRRSCDALKK